VDIAVAATLILSFALLATAHVAIGTGLLTRPPRWRAALAFLVPPLAPFWGFREGLRVWSGIWLASVAVYAVCLSLAVL
jgi:hypothetical protein